MYWRDHNPPHLHAYYQGYEALFALQTGSVIAGSLPKRVASLIIDWIDYNKVDLLENWQRAQAHEPLN